MVYLPRWTCDEHAVVALGGLRGHFSLEHVREHQVWIASQRIAEAATGCGGMAQGLPLGQRARKFGWQLAPVPVVVEKIVGGCAGLASRKTVRGVIAPVGP